MFTKDKFSRSEESSKIQNSKQNYFIKDMRYFLNCIQLVS